MKKIFTFFAASLLMVSAWTSQVSAQTYNEGTWYSVYAEKEITNIVVGTKIDEWDVFAPAAGTVTFDYKKYSLLSINGKVKVEQSEDGSNYSDVGSVDYSDHKNYKEGSVSGISANIMKMKFTNTSTGVQVKNVKLPLAKHILLNGGDFGKTSVTKNYASSVEIGSSANIRADFRSFLTNGDITISLTDGDPEIFRLGSAENISGVLESSTAGNSYAVGANMCASENGSAAACAAGQLAKIGNYSFQIYFFPKAVADYEGTITITDGTSTATIKVQGKGVKQEALNVPIDLDICEGGSIEFRGKEYTEAITENIDAVGEERDTVYVVTVTVNPLSFTTEEKTINEGDEGMWNGYDLSTYPAGYQELYYYDTNEFGCDSVVTLKLTILEKIATGMDQTREERVQATKVIRNGVLYIRRGDALYGIEGKRIE
jgi:hypothetical protein